MVEVEEENADAAVATVLFRIGFLVMFFALAFVGAGVGAASAALTERLCQTFAPRLAESVGYDAFFTLNFFGVVSGISGAVLLADRFFKAQAARGDADEEEAPST